MDYQQLRNTLAVMKRDSEITIPHPTHNVNVIFNKEHPDFKAQGSNALNIPKDEFLETKAFKDYEQYRINDRIISKAIAEETNLTANFIAAYQNLNPNHWIVYYKAGKYYYNKGWYKASEVEFQKALTKEITTVPDKIQIEEYLKKIKRRRK